MRAKRIRYHLLVMTVGFLFPTVVKAQQSDSIKADSAAQQQAYESRRGALVKELQDTQDKLGDLRSQRVRLEARIENVFRYAHVYPRAINLMAAGKIDVKPLITDRFPFEDSVKAFEFAANLPPTSVKVQIEL